MTNSKILNQFLPCTFAFPRTPFVMCECVWMCVRVCRSCALHYGNAIADDSEHRQAFLVSGIMDRLYNVLLFASELVCLVTSFHVLEMPFMDRQTHIILLYYRNHVILSRFCSLCSQIVQRSHRHTEYTTYY